MNEALDGGGNSSTPSGSGLSPGNMKIAFLLMNPYIDEDKSMLYLFPGELTAIALKLCFGQTEQ